MVAADTGTTFRSVGLNDEGSKSVALSEVDTFRIDNLKDLIALYQKKLCTKDNGFRFKEIPIKTGRLRAIKPVEDENENIRDDHDAKVKDYKDNNNDDIESVSSESDEPSGGGNNLSPYTFNDSPKENEKGILDKMADKFKFMFKGNDGQQSIVDEKSQVEENTPEKQDESESIQKEKGNGKEEKVARMIEVNPQKFSAKSESKST
jgi:hypothetical protein